MSVPHGDRARPDGGAEPRSESGAGKALREAAFTWAARAAEAPSRPGEPEWLGERRRAAARRFQAAGFPTTHEEEWRFTSLDPVLREELALAPVSREELALAPESRGATSEAAPLSGPEPLAGEHRFVVTDGALRTAAGALPQGLEVMTLQAALVADPERLRADLGALAEDASPPPFRGLLSASPPSHALLDLNTALFEGGVLVRVRAGVVVAGPVHLVFRRGAEGAAAHVRVLVVLEPGAQATLVESWLSGAGDRRSLLNAATEIALGAGAVLRHVRVQAEGDAAFHLATLAVRQDRDASYTSHVVSMGAALSRLDLQVVLDGPGATCTLEGLYVAAGKQHADHHTFVDHRQPRTTSLERFKGIVDGAARTVFEGRVKVRQGAQKISAHQENRNLLLSDQALAHTKPSLEIDADDVKCSHGATVGQLEEDPLFYLRARGIGADEARAMLTQAFAREVLERLQPPALRRRLAAEALARVGAVTPAGSDPFEGFGEESSI